MVTITKATAANPQSAILTTIGKAVPSKNGVESPMQMALVSMVMLPLSDDAIPARRPWASRAATMAEGITTPKKA